MIAFSMVCYSPRRAVARGAAAIAVLIAFCCGPAAAQQATSTAEGANEWPQFLGPSRNGISAETGLIDRFPESGPKEVWRKNIGGGMSGLAVSRGRLLTMTQSSGRQWLLALDALTGDEIWKTAVAPQYKNAMGHGPRGTPTIDGERVYCYSGEGILTAVQFDDGEVVWSRDTVEELGGEPAEYGMACSPLVGEQVIVVVGAPRATVAAYDVRTGQPAWTAGDDAAGYSSPALLDVGGREQIVVYAGSAVLGLAPGSGDVLWRYPFETDFNCNIAVPLAWEDKVFISSGENHGCALLELSPRNDGYLVEEVWTSLGPMSVLRNEWQTSVLLDGHLYGLDNVGGAGPITHLNCVDVASGEQLWQEERFGKGNLIAADGKLFIVTLDGELVIVRPSPDGYEELDRAPVLGLTRQAPALSGGLMYLRDNEQVVCLDVRE